MTIYINMNDGDSDAMDNHALNCSNFNAGHWGARAARARTHTGTNTGGTRTARTGKNFPATSHGGARYA